jgi:hypothetical protein
VGKVIGLSRCTDPVAVVDAYIAATGNPEAQLRLVADDITLRIEPQPPGTTGVWSGKAEAQGFFGFSKSQDVHLERIGSWQVSGDSVTGTVMVTVNDFRKWNVGAVQHQYEFVVQSGKIKSFASIMAPSERDRVAAAAAAYFAAHPPAGMPRTGGEQSVPGTLLITLGMLATLVGFSLRRMVKPNIQ